MARDIASIILVKEGSEPLYADENFRYEETSNGVIMYHGKSRSLIPWHRIHQIDYARDYKSNMTTVTLDMGDVSREDEVRKTFNSENQNWNPNPEFNDMFLRAQQAYCNDLLNSRGHLFLNEVYDLIGLPRTRWGVILGWTEGSVVDFSIDKSQESGSISLVFNPARIIIDQL